ncbi:MAG: hypothetical protein IRZ16_12650 [Myxococcaceae bacterium]|nr:hypothetical protein [Myxococcaceae bacterium]
MRMNVHDALLTLFAAGAIGFGACNGPPGESYRRPVDQVQAASRGEQQARDQLPMNAVGGSSVAGGGLSDPGDIQTGGPRPLGIAQNNAPPQGVPSATEEQDPQSDFNVQGQGNPKPGFDTQALQRALESRKPVAR